MTCVANVCFVLKILAATTICIVLSMWICWCDNAVAQCSAITWKLLTIEDPWYRSLISFTKLTSCLSYVIRYHSIFLRPNSISVRRPTSQQISYSFVGISPRKVAKSPMHVCAFRYILAFHKRILQRFKLFNNSIG
jgi:hypothetical protein